MGIKNFDELKPEHPKIEYAGEGVYHVSAKMPQNKLCPDIEYWVGEDYLLANGWTAEALERVRAEADFNEIWVPEDDTP